MSVNGISIAFASSPAKKGRRINFGRLRPRSERLKKYMRNPRKREIMPASKKEAIRFPLIIGVFILLD